MYVVSCTLMRYHVCTYCMFCVINVIISIIEHRSNPFMSGDICRAARRAKRKDKKKKNAANPY